MCLLNRNGKLVFASFADAIKAPALLETHLAVVKRLKEINI